MWADLFLPRKLSKSGHKEQTIFRRDIFRRPKHPSVDSKKKVYEFFKLSLLKLRRTDFFWFSVLVWCLGLAFLYCFWVGSGGFGFRLWDWLRLLSDPGLGFGLGIWVTGLGFGLGVWAWVRLRASCSSCTVFGRGLLGWGPVLGCGCAFFARSWATALPPTNSKNSPPESSP